jgi:hypothetical protein
VQHKAFAELITKDGNGLRQQVGAEKTGKCADAESLKLEGRRVKKLREI